MKPHFLIAALLFLFIAQVTNAQNYLEGKVIDVANNKTLSDVFIKNITANKITVTDEDGEFEIQGSVGNLLVFSTPGYVPDTMVVVDLYKLTVKLKQTTSLLNEVNVRSQRETFDPHTEYPEVYSKSKVWILSPSSLFGKEAKNARRLKKYFEQEEKERAIDQAFSIAYVSSLVPLRGVELQTFMAMYRPSFEFVQSNSGPSLASYISDSYKKYKELPPEKRQQSSLQGQ
ncbi:peptidase associated/transthyretin-like domain-containing protein [Mucilaginibacter auburnensis]|uniref:Carboxypeptidase-like protein n=1 Tax=Mucilaginibacter auburnensis TaxID=1457233 RepID=A0A2H9VU56_9SPHI|nr:hypothetical protein [Mucilaginibacter auburnensis]PJJ84363.1 hypothetical protein CLV57_1374 [Mucilaginibacter auburnensis]